jgi:endonuclease YncB( thermonuclease family)
MERRQSIRRSSPRFTAQQKLILGIVTVMCGLLLALAAGLVMMTVTPPGPSTQGLPPPASAQAQPPAPLVQDTPAAATPRALPQLPACAASLPAGAWADAAQVIDGSTLEVLVNGAPLRIGFAGVRVAEESALNALAAEAARPLLEGQPVYLAGVPAAKDDTGRSLRYVFAGDRFINLELIQMGLAKADVYADEKTCINLLQQGEQQARADHTGVWKATPAPTATFVPMVTLDPAFQPPCDCSARPECSIFDSRSDAQACYNACNDYNSRLDNDRDGLACEGLP